MSAARDKPPSWTPVTGEDRLPYDVHFKLRLLRDVFVEATAAYWLQRAEQLDAARPRPGDQRGQAMSAELAERDTRLAAAAQACRNRAALGDVARSEFTDAFEDWIAGAAA